MAELRPGHDGEDEVLVRLAGLSAALDIGPAPDDLVTLVQARVRSLPTPAASTVRRRLARSADILRRHRRAAVAVVVALLIGLLAVTPAGARIAQWLGIGAVQVIQENATPTGRPDPASVDGFTEVTLQEAVVLASFRPAVPAALGAPDRVLINPANTVVSMVWVAGDPAAPGDPVRLDQVAGQPDYAVVKKYADHVEFTRVGGRDAFWLRVPHPLAYTDSAGTPHTESSRVSGPTLIWQDGPVTLRLEGFGDLRRALQVARSTG